MAKKKILIIEDDQDARLAMNVRLKANNYETYFAVDGVSAISETRKCQPDLVILDLGLPAGDGYSVMDRLRNNPQFSAIPVVVVSGRDFRVHRTRSLRSGASIFLQKPVDDDVLLGVIHKLLRDQPSTFLD